MTPRFGRKRNLALLLVSACFTKAAIAKYLQVDSGGRKSPTHQNKKHRG